MPRRWVDREKVSIRLDLEGELLDTFKHILKAHSIDTASATEGVRFLIREEYKQLTAPK